MRYKRIRVVRAPNWTSEPKESCKALRGLEFTARGPFSAFRNWKDGFVGFYEVSWLAVVRVLRMNGAKNAAEHFDSIRKIMRFESNKLYFLTTDCQEI